MTMTLTSTEDRLIARRQPARNQPERFAFTVLDDAVGALDNPLEPWSVQLEVGVTGRLDEPRLRAAIAAAMARHPMARARAVPARLSDRHARWEITATPNLDPLRIVDCPRFEDLDAARAELYSTAIPLTESPPLRLALAHRPQGDLLLLNVNHAAFDGFGAVRFLRSIARAYTGEADPAPVVELDEARDIERHLAAPDRRTRARRFKLLGSWLLDMTRPTARFAADPTSADAGYGFCQISLPADLSAALTGRPATVNDLLVGALHLAIAGWNAEHDAECDRVGVLVPVNLRPQEWREDMATNLVLQARIVSTVDDRTHVKSLLRSVREQSDRLKSGEGAALFELLRRWATWPVWAKRLLSPALTATGNRLVDTAILSNLGRLDAPEFGPDAGETTECWFSAPTRMPCGLSVGAVTLDKRLHLSFRYHRSLLSDEAGRRFAHRFLVDLDRVSGQDGHVRPKARAGRSQPAGRGRGA
ncbi:MAG: condensation domain-containing protein [Acidimicrobiales bacterium]